MPSNHIHSLKWDGIERVLRFAEAIAVLTTAVVVCVQSVIIGHQSKSFADSARAALMQYDSSAAASRAERTLEWSRRIMDDSTWERWRRVDIFFATTPRETQISAIEASEPVRNDLHVVLAQVDQLAYFYNTGALDLEFIRHTSGPPLMRLHDQAEAWLQHRRQQFHNPKIGNEYERMVADLRVHLR
jgi:cell division protein FtsL